MQQSKWKLVQQQKAAEQFMREHRALWTKPSSFETMSLDENPEAFEDIFEVTESNPEYILIGEQEVDLIDIMFISDSDAAATASESVQPNPFNF